MFSLTRKPLGSKTLFNKVLSLFLSLMLFLTSLGNTTAQALLLDDVETIIKSVPTGQRWKEHLQEELLPFWTMDTALGTPEGNFPTYRCNDGSLYDAANPCIELKEPINYIVKLDRDYVRAKSRQVFAYGVAYNMTGEPKYLQYAKEGVDYLRKYALDRKNGGAYTYFKEADRQPEPEPKQRISQDLAYAVSGLGFFYYLTREPEILDDILALKDYIFHTYYDEQLDLIAWVKDNYLDYVYPDGTEEYVKTNQKELVAQLDQVYGYMLLLTPTLPEPYRSEWKKDLVNLAQIMLEQFYTPKENIFWGATTYSNKEKLGTDHTDFGHSIKTLWLIYEIGKLTKNFDLILFAQEKAPKILEQAYIKDTGSWARRIDEKGKLDKDKEWWILAELDQVAATLSLKDPSYAKYLPGTYKYWFEYMVDREHKGVWHWVKASNNKPDIHFPKQHSWKNAFHTFEHALVGYLTGQELHDLPSQLYFAFKEVPENKTQIHPYIYAAKVEEIKEFPGEVIPGFRKQEVTFIGIR